LMMEFRSRTGLRCREHYERSRITNEREHVLLTTPDNVDWKPSFPHFIEYLTVKGGLTIILELIVILLK